MNARPRFLTRRNFFLLLCLATGFWLAPIATVRAQLIYADTFDYPDGPIVGAPGSPWVNNYPPTNEASVVSRQLFLTGAEQESVRVNFPAASSGALYSRMTVNFSSLPVGDGNFFAFFRINGGDNLRCRIWAGTNGAAPGTFRLGITTIFFPPVMIPRDLHLGSNYTLVSRYDVTNCHSTLWIDPTDERVLTDRAENIADAGASAIGHYGFLQTAYYQTNFGNFIGSLTVDDLRIGRTFAEVFPFVTFTSISNSPDGVVRMQASGQATTNYVLEANTNLLTANWVNLGTNTAGSNGFFNLTDSNAASFPRRFYRLLKQ